MKYLKIASLILSILLLAGCSHNKQSASPTAPFVVPSPQEIEEAMQAAGITGPQHKLLTGLVGKWKAEVKWWMDPSGKPEVSQGISVNTVVLGGKFIREDYAGKMMGRPFQGVGYLGYDNVAKQYTSSWMDSMSTAAMTGTGSYDAVTKSWSYFSSMSCPLTNSKREFKTITRVVDKNHHVMEMYDHLPDGKEFLSMQIDYKRTK